MNYPLPIKIGKKVFNISSYQVPELEFKLPSYPKRQNFTTIEMPQITETLNTFYKALFKTAIEGKIDEFYDITVRIIGYLNNRFELELFSLKRNYAIKIKNLNSSFGRAGHLLPSGVYQRELQEVHINEFEEFEKLYLKYLEEYRELLSKYLSGVIDTVLAIGDTYLDIYKTDFNVTYQAYRQLLENLVNAYNDYLTQYRVFLMEKDIYREVYEELINIERRKFDRLSWLLREKSLEEEQKEAINRYLTVYSQYLVELERYAFLQYEEYEVLIRKYENELRKFRTQIQYTEALAGLIEANIRRYRADLRIGEVQQEIKDAKLDATMQKVRATNALLEAKEAEMRAKVEEQRASLSAYEADITKLETELVKYRTEIEEILLEYRENVFRVLQQLMEYEKNLVSLLETELKVRHDYLYLRNSVILDNEKKGMEAYESVRKAMDEMRIRADMVKDYNRTMAIAYSQVTAEIIRSFE